MLRVKVYQESYLSTTDCSAVSACTGAVSACTGYISACTGAVSACTCSFSACTGYISALTGTIDANRLARDGVLLPLAPANIFNLQLGLITFDSVTPA